MARQLFGPGHILNCPHCGRPPDDPALPASHYVVPRSVGRCSQHDCIACGRGFVAWREGTEGTPAEVIKAEEG